MSSVLDHSAPRVPARAVDPLSAETAMRALTSQLDYLKGKNYEGHDLFDGLSSKLFRATPLRHNRLSRLALIQLCKRSPLNLRAALRVPAGFNPKGGALFLMGRLNLLCHTREAAHADEAHGLFRRLQQAAIERLHGLGWGYNFDWQSRAFYVPEGTPNLVTSVYVGRALLAYHEQFDDRDALRLALAITDFILSEMIKFENSHHVCYNYIPGKDTEVHNANLLGASHLARTLPYLPEAKRADVREKILKSVRFSISDIRGNGAWPYGTESFHRWVDNFHTAFNIECLLDIGTALKTEQFLPILQDVTDYYLINLFTPEGVPKYYNNKLYPVDVHVLAEAIIATRRLRDSAILVDPARREQIEQTLAGLLIRFQDEAGFFYHQQLSASRWNRIPYIRWGQAWMFYALSICLRPADCGYAPPLR
jgi:polysaccharide biosynthesis protein VpsJ